MSNPKQTITKYTAGKKTASLNKRLLVIGVAGLVFVALMYLLIQRDVLFSSSQCHYASSSPLYEKAAAALKRGDIGSVGAAVADIKRDKDYKNDPNCMYPVVAYYIMLEDVGSAQFNYSKLARVYDSKKGFAKVYRDLGVSDIKEVKASLDRLEAGKEESNGNTLFFNR